MTGLRWGIYVRISDDRREGAGLGVRRQEKDAREKIAREDPGGVVVEVYSDNDTSAYSGKRRPGYERMLADIASGRINAICAWHNDRLHRNPSELEAFIKLTDGVRITTVKAGDIDLSTAAGRLVARILGAAARHESEHKAERNQRKHAELAAAGKASGGGKRSYGFQPVYDRPELPHKLIREEIVPEEAGIIRECASRALRGEGLYTLAADLNDRGITTASGGPWYRTSLARILASAKIAGLREHRAATGEKPPLLGEITSPGRWDDGSPWLPIITPEESRQLRRILDDPKRRTAPGPPAGPAGRWLCAGALLVCGRCRKPMVGRRRPAPAADRYICHPNEKRENCGGVSIRAAETDLVITGWVAAYLPGPAWRRALQQATGGPDESILHADIAAAERKRAELSELWSTDKVTREEWLAAGAALTARIERARRQLSPSSAAVVVAGLPADSKGIQAFLLDETVPAARRRAVLKAVLVKVTVLPAARQGRQEFDVSRLDPEWRA